MLTAATTLVLTWTAPAGSASEVRFHWRAGEHALDALPADLPAPAAVALDQWAAWGAEHGYGLFLEDSGTVLYVAEQATTASLGLIGRTVEFFDARLPAPERAATEAASATRTEGPWQGPPGQGSTDQTEQPDVIPDDPESGAAGVPLVEAPSGTPEWKSSWGAGSDALDRDTLVLLALARDDYSSALQNLVDKVPSLAAWATSAKTAAGFVLESPLVGAWLVDEAGQEEFDPNGELVHRLTDLLVLRRFGRQPYWIVQGTAWHAEMNLRGAIYCYPARDEFVYTVEHESWPLDVRNQIKKEFKKKGALAIDRFSALRRGRWNGEAARLAYGAMAWLLENRAAGLPAALEELRLTYERESRIDKGGGLWERDVTYEVSDATVQQAFEKHLGPDVLAELTEGLKTLR
jgi:hypothetical protein